MSIKIKPASKAPGDDRLVICDGEVVGRVTQTRYDVTYTCVCSAKRTTKFLSDLRSKIEVHRNMAHS